jgi:DNA-binding protein YbaB
VAEKCGAKKRQGESVAYCKQPAGWGTDHPGVGHCKLHGGNTKGQKIQAARVQADREARAVLAELDVDPVDDPLTALSQVAGQATAWQKSTAELVNRLSQIRYEGAAGGEQLRAEVSLFERATDRLITVLSTIARLDIDGRLVRIEEAKAQLLMDAVQAGLDAIGITTEQATQVKQVMARKLRAVS